MDGNTNSIHDIHTKFTIPDIYKIMSSNLKYGKLVNPVSKEIPLEVENIDGMHIHVSIHRTDTITVIVGCSKDPIILDESGITRLSCGLTRIEERLSRRLDERGRHCKVAMKEYQYRIMEDGKLPYGTLVKINLLMNILRKVMH